MNQTPTRIPDEDTRPWYAPFVPPGMKLSGELGFFALSMLLALGYTITYTIRLSNAVSDLYIRRGGQKELIDGAVMPMFYTVFDHAWKGFFIVLLCMLGCGVYHYLYYRQESKSIWTMRRLPDRISFFRYTWTLTVCEIFVCLVFALGCFLVSFWMYHTITPPECLIDGQWELFWETMFSYT